MANNIYVTDRNRQSWGRNKQEEIDKENCKGFSLKRFKNLAHRISLDFFLEKEDEQMYCCDDCSNF